MVASLNSRVQINEAPDEPADLGAGLSVEEAALRLARDGPNELPRKGSRSAFKIVGEVLREPMLLLLRPTKNHQPRLHRQPMRIHFPRRITRLMLLATLAFVGMVVLQLGLYLIVLGVGGLACLLTGMALQRGRQP